ncbi:MAG: hypothetical protein EA426_19695 [Spirochaetaceae bacterium]|nr:MAG: hypothetical protein EA426_19695 [Spirochaetaceae bacterium]
MKATVLFWVHGIAALVFGLGFLLVPAMMTDMMNVPTDSMGLIGWQFFGLGILTIGGIAWGSRNKLVREVKFPIMLMVFFVLVAMTVLHAVLALFGGLELNLVMWSVILYHIGMAAWYGYFLFASEKAPESQAQPAA